MTIKELMIYMHIIRFVCILFHHVNSTCFMNFVLQLEISRLLFLGDIMSI